MPVVCYIFSRINSLSVSFSTCVSHRRIGFGVDHLMRDRVAARWSVFWKRARINCFTSSAAIHCQSDIVHADSSVIQRILYCSFDAQTEHERRKDFVHRFFLEMKTAWQFFFNLKRNKTQKRRKKDLFLRDSRIAFEKMKKYLYN